LVSSNHSEQGLVIVARPNHSSSWRGNQLLLLALAVPSLGTAVALLTLGAWPVLPFAGLEITALGIALYRVNRKLQYRHVITLSRDAVRIDKGYDSPLRSWQLRRPLAALSVTPERHPWEGPRISVHCDEESVSVGEFLAREDSLSLLALLRRELLVRSYSPHGQRLL